MVDDSPPQAIQEQVEISPAASSPLQQQELPIHVPSTQPDQSEQRDVEVEDNLLLLKILTAQYVEKRCKTDNLGFTVRCATSGLIGGGEIWKAKSRKIIIISLRHMMK